MDIPEEEIEQAIIWDLGILKIRPSGDLKLIQRQRALSTSDGYIDLLLKDSKRYYIVELKRDYIKNKTIVTDQLLRYRNSLMTELNLNPEDFVCILASTQGFSDDVKQLCKNNGVKAKRLDEDYILAVLADKTKEFATTQDQETISKIILNRRIPSLTIEKSNVIATKTEVDSVLKWVYEREHNEHAKKSIANLFKKISSNAPIQAHQVRINGTDGKYSLDTFEKKWFWLFYTVLDKRSNASLFIKAKEILDKINLYLPEEIIDHVEEFGDEYTIEKITKELEKNGFPLLHDFKIGRFAAATSIVDAAKFITKYDYDFDKFYHTHLESSKNDPNVAIDSIIEEIKSIRGVGQRMAAQFVRGMVLKERWNLPLTDNTFLEKGKYNAYFAGPARFSLIKNEKEYEEELGQLADQYLDGNRSIISHSLWYIRKKYCGKVKHCGICPLASHCSYYLKTNTIMVYTDKQEPLLKWMFDLPEIIKEEKSKLEEKSDLIVSIEELKH